jgi:hypothetical protein
VLSKHPNELRRLKPRRNQSETKGWCSRVLCRPGIYAPVTPWSNYHVGNLRSTISDSWLRRGQYCVGRLLLSQEPDQSAHSLPVGRYVYCRNLPAGACLGMRRIPRSRGIWQNRCGRSFHWGVFLGLQNPPPRTFAARVDFTPCLLAFREHGGFPGEVSPLKRHSVAATAGHFFAAACSAFESVSFSGWTIVLFTARRAAPRLGNSDSTPSRCKT